MRCCSDFMALDDHRLTEDLLSPKSLHDTAAHWGKHWGPQHNGTSHKVGRARSQREITSRFSPAVSLSSPTAPGGDVSRSRTHRSRTRC